MFVDYAQNNNIEKLKECINAGEDINQFLSGRNALHAACISNSKEAAEILINNGIDVNARDSHTGATPLHYCAVYNYIEIAKRIIDHGGKLDIADNYGNQPLWTAVFNVRGKEERLPLVELFLTGGSNKNHKNNAGRSPLDFAEQIKYMPVINLLSKY